MRITLATSDRDEGRAMMAGPDLVSAIWELDNELRSLVKHCDTFRAWGEDHEMDDSARNALDAVREQLRRVLDEHGLLEVVLG